MRAGGRTAVAAGRARHVDLAGGRDSALAKAGAYAEKGDLRFAATVLNHLVFADAEDTEAKNALASVYERLGRGAENGTWRNFSLSAALELRSGAGGGLLERLFTLVTVPDKRFPMVAP
nr:alkyl sulfatase dimerization domain-containing protein [Streptomyces sp. SJL17-1]